MFRVALSKENGDIISRNFKTKDDAEVWLLEMMDNNNIKNAYIFNKETKEKIKVI